MQNADSEAAFEAADEALRAADEAHDIVQDYEWENEKSNKLVFIGKDLDHQTIKKQLDFCRFTSKD